MSKRSCEGILKADKQYTHSSSCQGKNNAPPPLTALEPDTVQEPKPRLKVKSFEHHSPKKRPYRPKSLWFSSVKEDKSQDNHFSNSDSAGRELPKQNKECLPPRQAYSHSSSLGIFDDKFSAIRSANEYSQKKGL